MDSELSIVCVDDDELTALWLQGILKKHFKTVNCFSSASKALEFAEEKSPDVLITNFHMPDMNGLELVMRLKDSPNFKGKVIFLTSTHIGSLPEEITKQAADNVLNKPLSEKKLLEMIRSVLTPD